MCLTPQGFGLCSRVQLSLVVVWNSWCNGRFGGSLCADCGLFPTQRKNLGIAPPRHCLPCRVTKSQASCSAPVACQVAPPAGVNAHGTSSAQFCSRHLERPCVSRDLLQPKVGIHAAIPSGTGKVVHKTHSSQKSCGTILTLS